MTTFQNLLIGVLGSLIATVVFLFYANWSDKRRERKKYAASVGKYNGYGTTVPQGTMVDKNRLLSKIEIR